MKLLSIILLICLLACQNTDEGRKEKKPESLPKSSAAKKIPDLNVEAYAIYTESDTIEYLRMGTESKEAKPSILFLQGSLPRPLIFDFGSFKHLNLPFDHKSLSDRYNLIEIAMPRTPIMAKKESLDQQYCYLPDPNSSEYSEAYLQDNYLENYVNRTKLVIQDLQNRRWSMEDSLILIGHSQGAKIATVVAAESQDVSSLALLGFNAYGRFDEYIRRARRMLNDSQLSADDYPSRLQELYQDWQDILQKPNDFKNGNNAWTSFSKNYLADLLSLDIPIFIGYGTKDLIAENCDLIPLEFIEKGKANLSLKPYPGLDHNFFELKDGRADRKQGSHFSEVINDIIRWTENPNSKKGNWINLTELE